MSHLRGCFLVCLVLGCASKPTTTGKADTGTVTAATEVGKPCTTSACSSDKSTWLMCEKGVYVVGLVCAGDGATCGLNESDMPACNNMALANLGTACGIDSLTACSPDLTSRLRCRDGAFMLDQTCAKGCDPHGIDECVQ